MGKTWGFPRRFAANTRGNFAITLALALIPVAVSAGLALDFTVRNRQESRLQHAVDAATLAVGQHMSGMNDDELRIAVQEFIDENIDQYDSNSLKQVEIDIDRQANRLEVSARGATNTSFGRLVGIEHLAYGADASVGLGQGNAEVVLVLDSTASMGRGDPAPILGLQAAATLFANRMMSSPGVKIGVVPFAQYVNVGVHNAGESWLSVPSETTGEKCEYPVISRSGCTLKLVNVEKEHGGIWKEVCEVEIRSEVEVCKTWTKAWTGCVLSRPQPYNLTDDDYDTRKIPGKLDDGCSRPITPLTTDRNAVVSAIGALHPQQQTYIPTGLIWGLRVLSGHEPLTGGTLGAANGATTHAVVLMSDGDNTRGYENGGYHNGTFTGAARQADEWTLEICELIKAKGARMFTVSYGDEVSTGTKAMLAACATDANHAYDAQNAGELSDAFESIGASMTSYYLMQ